MTRYALISSRRILLRFPFLAGFVLPAAADTEARVSEIDWMTWAAVLIAWPLVGLGVAYLFGRIIRGMESPESATDQPLSDGHVRPKKRVKRNPRACAKQVRRKHGTEHPFPKGRRYMTPYNPIARRSIRPFLTGGHQR